MALIAVFKALLAVLDAVGAEAEDEIDGGELGSERLMIFHVSCDRAIAQAQAINKNSSKLIRLSDMLQRHPF